MSWGAVVGAGVGLVGSAISGNKAKKAAKSTKPTPYAVSGPAGQMGVHKGQLSLEQGNNPFAQVFRNLGLNQLRGVGQMPDQFLYGADPELAKAYEGLFGQGLTDRIQGQYDLLSQIAAPGERRDSQALDDLMFSRGMSGTTGGAERFRALEEAQSMADLQRQAQAVGLGRQEALDRFTGAQGAIGQGMGSQLQQFNIGQGAFGGSQQLLQNLFQQAGLGIAAGGGQAPGAAVYAAQAQSAPYQAAANFLQNSGLLNFGGYQSAPIYSGGGAPMVNQPSGPINIPGVGMPMPSGNFGL